MKTITLELPDGTDGISITAVSLRQDGDRAVTDIRTYAANIIGISLVICRDDGGTEAS